MFSFSSSVHIFAQSYFIGSHSKPSVRDRLGQTLQQSALFTWAQANQFGIPTLQRVLELLAHSNQLLDSFLNLPELRLGQRADPMTRNSSLVSDLQDGGQFRQGKADTQRSANQSDSLQSLSRVVTIATASSGRLRKK